MKLSQKLKAELATVIPRLEELTNNADLSESESAELGQLTTQATNLQARVNAAVGLEAATLGTASAVDDGVPSHMRERVALRQRCSVTNFVRAAVRGKGLSGPELELLQESGFSEGQIPIEVFDVPRTGIRADVTPAPGTGTGVNVAPIQPELFAPSIAPTLQIEMPMVASGAYSIGRISQSVTAAGVAKGADVPQSAGTIVPKTTTPKRIGGSMGVSLEDVATIGAANFESALRDNLSMVLSAELDDQMINGDTSTTATDINGILEGLGAATGPAANVETFDRFAAILASGVDGLWAMRTSDVAMVVGVDTYILASSTFQSAASFKGEMSSEAYMRGNAMEFRTNKRMPAKVAHIQAGILVRRGRGARIAVCPHWGYLSIDDIVTGARKGERYLTLSVLLGDVIVVQPDAYQKLAFRVST